ncbi:lasso RiPP family leader peptide-containing protein [Embleya sp. NPDC050154]
MTYDDSYEPPALVEVGDFTELTLGLWWGCPHDVFGGPTPLAC